jgi:glycosyltransferase involved in cell wall biosynthesis
MGWVHEEELASLYSRARGLIFPGREDFGIVAAESAAAGCPVIAYNGGGALDFLTHTVNACLFESQTPESLADALDRFERRDWPESPIRASVQELSRERFQSEFEQVVRRVADARLRPGAS